MIHGKTRHRDRRRRRADARFPVYMIRTSYNKGARRGAARRHLEAGDRSDRRQVLSGRRRAGGAQRDQGHRSRSAGRVDIKRYSTSGRSSRRTRSWPTAFWTRRAGAAADRAVFPEVSVRRALDESVVAPCSSSRVVLALAGAAFLARRPDRDRAWPMRTSDWRRCSTPKPRRPATTVEQSLGLERRVPVVGDRGRSSTCATARGGRGYWRTDYAALAPQRDADGSLTETDPALLLLSANAAFRATQQAARSRSTPCGVSTRSSRATPTCCASGARPGGRGATTTSSPCARATRWRSRERPAPKAAPKPQATAGDSRSAGRSDAARQAGRTAAGGQHEPVQDRHPEARRGTQRCAGRRQGWTKIRKG